MPPSVRSDARMPWWLASVRVLAAPASRAAPSRRRARGVKPKCRNSSAAGADSPKRSMPITAPSRPTYLRQKSGDAGLDRPRAAGAAAARARGRPRPGGRRRVVAGHRDDAHGDAFLVRVASRAASASAHLRAGRDDHRAWRRRGRRPARSRRGGCSPRPAAGASPEAAGSGATAAGTSGRRGARSPRPGDGGLRRVAGPPDVQVRDQAQRRPRARSAGASGRPRRDRSSRA